MQLVEALRYKPEGRFPIMSSEFFIDIIIPAFNKNKYQEYFLGGKGGRCLVLTALPPSCADCLEIWEPQPPGTPQGLSRPVQGVLYLISL